MNTTMNNGCTESGQKHTNICAGRGVGKGSPYEIHTIMKIMERIVCYMLKVGQACTSQILSSTMSVGNCSNTDLVDRGRGGVRLPHHWEGQMQNKTLSIIIIIHSMYSNYKLSFAISNDF